jgi:hypothetical protein
MVALVSDSGLGRGEPKSLDLTAVLSTCGFRRTSSSTCVQWHQLTLCRSSSLTSVDRCGITYVPLQWCCQPRRR